jgi:hypothetical protein
MLTSDHVCTLSGWVSLEASLEPYPASYTRAYAARFPLAFRPTGVRFLVDPVPTTELGRSYDWLTGILSHLGVPDRIGVSTFHTTEERLGWVPSKRRDLGVPTSAGRKTDAACCIRSRTVVNGTLLISTGPFIGFGVSSSPML